MDTPDGAKFILGLTIDTKYSGSVFIPGEVHTVAIEQLLTINIRLPGQVIQTDNGMKVKNSFYI